MPDGWVALSTRPAGAAATRVSVVTADPSDTALWWKQFNDHTLDRLIFEALATNLDVAQARSRLQQSRAARAIAARGLWPSVGASGSYRRSGGGDNNGATRDREGGPRTSHDVYRAGFDASWEIDVFGGIRRNVEAADAAIEAVAADLDDVRVSLAAEVAVNYFSLRAAQERLAIATRNLDIQRHSVSLIRVRAAGGELSGLDLANAEGQVASTEAQIPALEASARRSVFDLSLLLGREPATLVEPLAPVPEKEVWRITRTPPNVPAGLPSDLLRRRPDIRAAEARLHAATANVGVAVADLFPRFSLSGSFGVDGNRPSRVFSWNNTGWSIGPSINWDLFAGGRLQAAVALSRFRAEEAFIVYERTVLTALRDVEQALTQYDFDQRRRLSLMAAVEANRRALRFAEMLYARGETDFLNLLNAQRGLLSTEDALAATDAQVAADLATIYKALGGGWEDADTLPPPLATPPATPASPQMQPATQTVPTANRLPTTSPATSAPASRPVNRSMTAPSTQGSIGP
jgi:NodT family efflux transporter outer membrane factor (OMF) lipoprotein